MDALGAFLHAVTAGCAGDVGVWPWKISVTFRTASNSTEERGSSRVTWSTGTKSGRSCTAFLRSLDTLKIRYNEFITGTSTNTRIRCHQNAFRYFGGDPEEILYGNMKQVVTKRILKQEPPTLNRRLRILRGSPDSSPSFAGPTRGQTKGKAERTVRFVRDNPMVGIRYSSLADSNGQATTKEIPFERLNMEGLGALSGSTSSTKSTGCGYKKTASSLTPAIRTLFPEYVGKDVAVGASMLAVYYEGKQIKDMVVVPQHDRMLKATPHHSKHRLACRFSVIAHSFRWSMVRWTALNL